MHAAPACLPGHTLAAGAVLSPCWKAGAAASGYVLPFCRLHSCRRFTCPLLSALPCPSCVPFPAGQRQRAAQPWISSGASRVLGCQQACRCCQQGALSRGSEPAQRCLSRTRCRCRCHAGSAGTVARQWGGPRSHRCCCCCCRAKHRGAGDAAGCFAAGASVPRPLQHWPTV
jgi:hypothetical protein